MHQGQVPDYILEMAVGALQHGVSAESLVALLNGNVSDSGVDITPYKDLGGCLSRLTEEERRIGGSLTEIIKVAQRSTVQRFAELQSSNARLQKDLCQARQQLTKIADDKKAAAMYEKKRMADRLQRRPVRNKELLEVQWGGDFVGLGLDEEVPKFLRTNAKVKNRHMSKVEAETAIQEIWNAKKLYEQEKQSSTHLQDFLYLYLVRSAPPCQHERNTLFLKKALRRSTGEYNAIAFEARSQTQLDHRHYRPALCWLCEAYCTVQEQSIWGKFYNTRMTGSVYLHHLIRL
ncbi:hypothetical protein ABBQ32_000953 [Trebouxia sp. C0010 RCD-2024]